MIKLGEPGGRCPWSRSPRSASSAAIYPPWRCPAAVILVGLTIWDHERVPPRSGPFAWISLHEAKQDGGTT